MPQNVVLSTAGIHTFTNYLGSVPQGALVEALNVVVDRNNIVEPRRGFSQYGDTFATTADRTKQIFDYKNRMLRHETTVMQYDDGTGTFAAFSGPAINETEAGLRIKSIEANGNLYFTTLTGIKKISAANAGQFSSTPITDAGGVKALDLTATPSYATAGFFSPSSQVAYRVVWGITDNNDNLILGSPSNRAVAINVSPTDSAVVNLTFAVPDDVTSTSYFYQVYRTGVFTGDPGDEMYLVFEDFVTAGQISAGVVNVTDITPEDFRANGALLYTNPQSGEGIEQANEKPPFAKDINLYKGYTFYSNTSTVQNTTISVLSVQALVSETSTLTISNGVSTTTYKFRGHTETYTADYSNGALTVNNFKNPGSTGLYFTIDAANDIRKYYVWYKFSNETDPLLTGRLGIMVDIATAANVTDVRNLTLTAIDAATDDFNLTSFAGPQLIIENSNNGYVTAASQTDNIPNFTIVTDGLGTGEDSSLSPPRVFLPKVPTGAQNGPTTAQQIEQMATSLVRVINQVDPIVQAFYISGANDVPGQILLQNRLATGPSFFLNVNDAATTGIEFSPNIPASGTEVSSTNEVRPNRIYYSKYQQPEAVPLVNFIDIGPKDRAIKRIIALRDSLFIFKEDGIYRLSGETSPFQVAPFDFSVQVLSADTAVVLNNQVYALSTQGAITVTDTGVSVISRPIENLLLNVTREGFDFQTISFGVSYESDRAYHLWTLTNNTDTVATQCFRYNTFTQCWTRWDKSATCGLVGFIDDKMYLGAGDKNFIEKERKSLTRTDFADRDFEATILADGIDGSVITLNSVSGIEIGDAVIQTQYLTINLFNRVLMKLDLDPSVADADYFSTLAAIPGDNLRTKLQDLATKLDADTGLSDTDYSSSIANYVQTITATTPGSSTVVTFSSNAILTGRFVTISGSNTSPAINGTHYVTASNATTITIPFTTSGAGTAGTVQTLVQDFRDIQGCFNIITAKLNNDSGAFFVNYDTSTGSTEFESVIIDIDDIQTTITIHDPIQFIEGTITVYSAIQTRVIWSPQFFSDPSIFKQVSEGTLMFENSNYTTAQIAYSTDLSPGFEEIEFQGLGNGDFGQFDFGNMNWGGIGAAFPLRTYVPRQKQRCRFMNVRFEHKVALEKFSLYGISLTFRPYSIRAFR